MIKKVKVNSKKMAAESNLKTLFDTRPLKQEAWLKCKDNLDHTQMSGLETIVEGNDLPNGFKRVHLEQVIRFMITQLNWRKEEDPTNAHNVTGNSNREDDEAEKLISDFLSSRGDFITSDIENGKPLASILKDYFESGRCINIDYKKKTMELSFDIFCHQSKIAKEKQWFLRLLKSEKQVWPITQ